MLLDSIPYLPGGPGGEMKCPVCTQNTPDSWKSLFFVDAGGTMSSVRVEPPPPLVASDVSLDYMYCANDECKQLVIRVHEHSLIPAHAVENPEMLTRTWLARPRKSHRTIDLLVQGPYRTDYLEAAAILDDSPQMSAVLSRRILGDLLSEFAGLTMNSLKGQIDAFIADESRPYELRANLHYLREMGDFGAHTQKDGEAQVIDVEPDEATWTLDVIDDLFDYFIISPQKSQAMRSGVAKKIEEAGRKEIPPLPDAPGEES